MHLSYKKFNTYLQDLVRHVLKIDSLKITAHTLRKTAYLFAVFRNAVQSDIHLGAHHADIKNSDRYLLDAQTKYEIIKEQGVRQKC